MSKNPQKLVTCKYLKRRTTDSCVQRWLSAACCVKYNKWNFSISFCTCCGFWEYKVISDSSHLPHVPWLGCKGRPLPHIDIIFSGKFGEKNIASPLRDVPFTDWKSWICHSNRTSIDTETQKTLQKSVLTWIRQWSVCHRKSFLYRTSISMADNNPIFLKYFPNKNMEWEQFGPRGPP